MEQYSQTPEYKALLAAEAAAREKAAKGGSAAPDVPPAESDVMGHVIEIARRRSASRPEANPAERLAQRAIEVMTKR